MSATQIRTSGTTSPKKRGNRRRGGNKNLSPKATPGEKTSQASTPNTEAVEENVDVVSAVLEVDVCWICAESVKYYALSECNHKICHVCALRLRALYKMMECTFCKEKQNSIMFTMSPNATFASFHLDDIPFKDPKLSLYFETQEMMEESLLLLRFNCPEQDCDYMAHGWGDLRLHVRATHGKFTCDLCVRFRKVFCHEHILYPHAALSAHLPSIQARLNKVASKAGLDNGAHPLCQFCRECFYGDDELYNHMREKHEECFVCKRNGILHQHFSNYEHLEKHFHTAHYPCTQPDCLASKFVVFDSPIDLKAHVVEQHGADMSSKDRKDIRRIQTDFTFDRPGGSSIHNHREREPPPQQPQPQQVERPTSRRREAFGASLTGPDALQPLQNSQVGLPNTPPTDTEPVDGKQAALLERIESLAPNPSAAVTVINASIRSYRLGESNAGDLIVTVWNVMDCNLEHTASIVNALVDTLDEEEKKTPVLSSWKGFVVEQKRQFPELIPTSVGSGYAGIVSGRVLNAKNAKTTRSSQSVWNRVAIAASSSGSNSGPNSLTLRPQERFPSLDGSSVPSRQLSQQNPTWSKPSIPHRTIRPPQVFSISSPRTNNYKAPILSKAQFPELPPSASKPKIPVSGNVSLINILGSSGPTLSAWAGGGSAAGTVEESIAQTPPANEPAALGRSKKKGKQKQTLFTLGSIPT